MGRNIFFVEASMKEDQQIFQSTLVVETQRHGNKTNTRYSSLDDEGFLVFEFQEDGTFHVVKDVTTEPSNSNECKSPKPKSSISKLNSVEIVNKRKEEEEELMLSEDEIDFCHGIEREYDLSNDKGEEDEESIYFDPETTPNEKNIEEESEESNDHRPISDSSTSDGSTNSNFAFPVLNRVWSGSPMKMPRSQQMHLRKHKHWRFILPCCRV